MLGTGTALVRSVDLVLTALLAVAPGVTQAVPGGGPQQSPRPSVVLIMMDDLGYGDLGSYGGADARTPNLDRLAREGVRLTNAYANGAVCTPTRAALMTGRYQQRVGLEDVLTGSPEDRDRGLAVTGMSLPALLKTSGYATALMGKWHLGFKPEFGPNAHGFDEFFGFLAGAHDYYATGTGSSGTLYENRQPVAAKGYLTDDITARAVDFITSHARTPFFVEVAYNAVHWPFQPPGLATSDPRRSAELPLVRMPDDSTPVSPSDYVSVLERADHGVGEILAALERLNLSRNTLVIFTNDNGGEWLSRNAPLFHRKGTLWEGGIRVPLIFWWPGTLKGGAVLSQPSITTDVTATIIAATNTATTPSYHPDGLSLLPILRGAASGVERDLFWRVIRPNRQQKAVRSGHWKLLVDGGQYLLFDLDADAGERNDLAARHPDIVRRLKGLLAAWERDVDARDR